MAWLALQSPQGVDCTQEHDDSVLGAVLDARRRAECWLEPARLQAAAEVIVRAARSSGAQELFATSPAGFCAIGVALTLDSGLRLYESGRAADVLLLDLAVAAPAGLATLAARLTETGATAVTTLVVDEHERLAEPSPKLAVVG